jgi:hypothetical protein
MARGDRYVALGLAHARSTWFRDLLFVDQVIELPAIAS